MSTKRALSFLVTAGPTFEDLDPVRYLGNRATGKLGFAAVRAALRRGHRVTLIHGPVAQDLVARLPHSPRLRRIAVRSAAQMHRACVEAFSAADVVIMNAAVADFAPARISATKIKKAQAGLIIRLKPTVDILKDLGRRKRARQRPLALIGFALETGAGRTAARRTAAQQREAQRKLEAKNLDAIVLDAPAAMGADRGEFRILRRDRTIVQTVRATKAAFARQLVKLGEELARGSA